MLVDLELVLKLHGVRFTTYCGYVYDRESRIWNYPETCQDNTAGFDEFKDIKPDTVNLELLYLIPDLMSYSDYSNGRVIQESNLKAFLVNHETDETEGAFVRLSGHYGSTGLAIRANMITEDMLDDLISLENYPVLDDSIMSELELEGQNEAWECWVEHDFTKELESKFDCELSCDDRELVELFYKLAERSNEYWFEDGCDQCIRIEKLVDVATSEDIASICVK